MKRIPLLIAAAFTATAALAAAPANADRWGGRGWQGEHHEGRREWREPAWHGHAGWGRPYYAPPVVAYAPSYYRPPAVYVAPPAIIVQPPFVGFGFR